MNLKKIIVYVVWSFILAILILKTFFTPNLFFTENLNFWDNFIWYKSFVFEKDWIIEKKINDIDNEVLFVKTVLSNKFNLLDNIYYFSDNYENADISDNWKNIEIKLSEWLFLLDLNNIDYNYSIIFKWFNIIPESFGKIFIDTRDSKQIIIFSLDWVYNVNLIDTITNKPVTNLYLYPHMYSIWNVSRIKTLKNADLFRLSKIFNIWYNNKELIIWDKINNDFINNIWSISEDSERKNFLLNVLNLIYINYNKSVEINKTLNNNNIWNVSWFDYIEKYFNYFQNDEKKIIFYKNLILKEINNLFKWTDKTEDIKLSIIDNLNELESLSIKDSNEIKLIIDWYFKVLTSNNDIENFNIKEDFSLLINKIKNNSSINNKSYLYLNSLFYSYNISSSDINYKEYLNNFIDIFYNDIWIDRINNLTDKTESLSIKENKLSNKDNILKNLNYLSFLLFNIIKSDFNFSENISDNNKLIKNYFLINELLLKNSWNDLKITYLYDYSVLLDIILNWYYTNFFEKQRDEKWLLLLWSNINFDKKEVENTLLKIDYLLSYISNNKNLLDLRLNRNKLIINANEDKVSLYNELKSAYTDYEQYKIDYDIWKLKLIDTDSVTINSDFSLSKEKILEYLKTFNWLYLNNLKIEIKDNYYYSISDIVLNWEVMSFDLYPEDWKRITNIYLPDENWIKSKIKFSYRLDEIKLERDEKIKEEDDKDKKEEFNFKSFFINTFHKTTNVWTVEYVENTSNEKEDRWIVILKKDKLLWEQWDFINVKEIINIMYDNINVIDKNWDYFINIVNATLKLKDNNSNSPLLYDFNSEYIFSNINHSFKNIELIPYDIPSWRDRKVYFLWEDTRLFIKWSYNILDIENFLNSNFWNLELTNKIATVIWIKNQILEFYPNINKIWSNFNYSWKDVRIMFDYSWSITSFKINWDNIEDFIWKKYIELKKILIKL